MLGNVKVRAALPRYEAADVAPSSQLKLTLLTLQKIRDRLLAAPAESLDLQSLVRAEIASKKHVAAEGLLWLTRYATPPNGHREHGK